MGSEINQGACLCGSIKFQVIGRSEKVLRCFCSDCQKNAGAPFQIVRLPPTPAI